MDEIDGDGSSFVTGKAIDYRKRIKNENFKFIEIQCVDICEVINSLHDYQKIILKLDVEGAEYEILEKLLESGLMSRVSKLYAEWHWNKMGLSQERHKAIYNRVKEHCPIQDWDALEMSVHHRDEERKKSRLDLLESVMNRKINEYQSHWLAQFLGHQT